MIRHAAIVATFLLTLLGAEGAQAKAPTFKIVVSGPGMVNPVELTEKEATPGVWSGGFMTRNREMAPAPAPDAPRYTVEFYAKVNDGDVRKVYVVYYVLEAANGRAVVQIPGTSDRWYPLNVSTISRCCAGKWFYAATPWAQAINRVLLAASPNIQASTR